MTINADALREWDYQNGIISWTDTQSENKIKICAVVISHIMCISLNGNEIGLTLSSGREIYRIYKTADEAKDSFALLKNILIREQIFTQQKIYIEKTL